MENYTDNKSLKPFPLGWKAKLGLLVPSHDTGYGSYEWRVLCPDGVVTLETRVMGRKLTLDQLKRMGEDAIQGAELLATAEPDVISYIATAASFILGVEGERAMVNEIRNKTGITATAGGISACEAFRFLGVNKMLMYVPTNEEITKKSVQYFVNQGFKVVGCESLGQETMVNINRMSPWEIYAGAMKLIKQHPEAEGIFITGGCFRTLEMIDTLEKDSGIPAVVTTPADMWDCLRLTGVKDLIHGFGQLLEKPR